jgi:hypothetical protein
MPDSCSRSLFHFRLTKIIQFSIIFLWLLAACQVKFSDTPTLSSQTVVNLPSEVAVQEIPLSKPASLNSAEISGMAWYQDTLVLLPQYPHRFGSNDQGALFALDKSTILSFIQDGKPEILSPKLIVFDDGGLRDEIQGFEGFEAIAFDGDQVFLTIEASPHKKMKGYLVAGRIQPDQSEIRLDPGTLVEIPLEKNISNLSDEAIIIYNQKILTFFEANGRKVNPAPVAHQFNLNLVSQGGLSFPNIEYRITDAVLSSSDGFFWAINTYFPLDENKLKPQADLLAQRYGQGKTHSQNLTVERLVEFQIQGDEISFVDQPPLQLVLEGDIAPRNWEAIALLDKMGFLLATDKFPKTIFGFVPFKITK